MDHCHSVQDRMSTMHALEVTKDAPELFLLSLPKKDLDLLHRHRMRQRCEQFIMNSACSGFDGFDIPAEAVLSAIDRLFKLHEFGEPVKQVFAVECEDWKKTIIGQRKPHVRIFEDVATLSEPTQTDWKTKDTCSVSPSTILFCTPVCKSFSGLQAKRSKFARIIDRQIEDYLALGGNPYVDEDVDKHKESGATVFGIMLFIRINQGQKVTIIENVTGLSGENLKALVDWCHESGCIVIDCVLECADGVLPQHRTRRLLAVIKVYGISGDILLTFEKNTQLGMNDTLNCMKIGALNLGKFIDEATAVFDTVDPSPKKFRKDTGGNRRGVEAEWIGSHKTLYTLANIPFEMPSEVEAHIHVTDPHFFALGAQAQSIVNYLDHTRPSLSPDEEETFDSSLTIKYVSVSKRVANTVSCTAALWARRRRVLLSPEIHLALQGWDARDIPGWSTLNKGQKMELAGDTYPTTMFQRFLIALLVHSPWLHLHGCMDPASARSSSNNICSD